MSAALDQPRDLTPKRVASEEADREPSPEKPASNSRSSTANGVDSTGHSRDGTPDQRRRSPSSATQEAASALVQMSNTSTPPQSPKKPSTPVQKRESVEEVADKFGSLSTNSPKHQQKSNDQQNILSNRDDALTCNVNNKRHGAGFRIDREYLNGEEEEHQELVAWQSDPEHEVETKPVLEERNKRGWAPDEMFRANDKLGVQSTYNGIEEYSNATPEGDDDARREADRIAAEIEGNKDSRRYALLENDDEERDLDKETRFNDRDGGRGSKRQSGGYPAKGNRSQFNSGMSGGGRNYTNSPRNSYPNTGSGSSSTNSGSRYNSGSQSRPQRGSYASNNYSSSNASSRQAAPTATSWRNEAAQQQSTGQQPTYVKPAVKSPTLHMEERRQSASPAAPKYSAHDSNNTTSIRRTNSVQNRQNQQPSYSPRPDAYAQQQVDRRVPDNRYHDGSTAPPTVSPHTQHQQVEVQPLITPIPKQTPTPQAPYDNQQQYVQEKEEEKPKKKFAFNPDAAVFVPKAANAKTTPTPSATPAMQMQSVIPAQSAVMTNVSHYNSQQVIPMNFMNVGMQQTPLILTQQPVFQQQSQMSAMQAMPPQQVPIQQIAQQRVYQPVDALNYVDSGKLMDQQKYAAARIQMQHNVAHPNQYMQQNPQYQQQIAHVVPPQMQMNSLPHPQFTGSYNQAAGMVSGSLSYHNAPAMVQQQQMVYPPYGYTNGQ